MKLSSLRRAAPDWRTVLSAVLIVFAFPPWNFSLLIWFALVPWLMALRQCRSYRHAALEGLWLGVLMTLGGFHWIAFVLHEFAGLPWIAAVIGLLLFSLIGQPQFILFALLERKASSLRAGLALAAALSLAYTGIDWVLPKLFVDALGHSLYQARNLRQLADVGGVPLLTFLIFFTNASIHALYTSFRNRNEPSAWPALRQGAPALALALALLLAGTFYGIARNRTLDQLLANPARTAQMAVIQGNIADFDKIAAKRGYRGAAHKILETYFGMSDEAMRLQPRPEVLVWPETSYPSTFRKPMTSDELERDQAIERFVQTENVPLLFGGYDRKGKKDYNAFFFLNPGKNPDTGGLEGSLKIYQKNILLLFGEYLPGADQFQFLKTAFPTVGNFGRGLGPEVVEIVPAHSRAGTIKVGPIICYEALFPNYIIAAARKGSELILNITNDGWFGPTAEPELHLSLVIFRSIEARLPQLRSTNTGISALILPNGEIAQQTGVYTQEIMNARVPLIEPLPTLMRAWGDWFGPAAFVLGLALLALFHLRERPRAPARQ